MTKGIGAASLFAVGFSLCVAAPALAQSGRLTIGVAGAHTAYDEVAPDNRQSGFGASGVARWDAGAWGVEGDLTWRSLSPTEDESIESFTTLGGAIRAHYRVWRELSVEAGFESRRVDPEFAAQDVASVLVGLRYEVPLASVADMWISGAAVPVSWFNGGGESGIGLAVGFGVSVRPGGGVWGLFADYDFRRLDRAVQSVDVPIEMEAVRLGFEYGIF